MTGESTQAIMKFLTILLQAQPSGLEAFGQFLPLIGILVVFYFFFILPQRKRAKEEKNFRESLQKGDEVSVFGGIYGKVAKIDETTLMVEIAENVKIKVDKSSIRPVEQANAGDKK